MRSVRIALAVSALAMAIAIIALMAQTPLIVAGTNAIADPERIDLPEGDSSSCQTVGVVPRGTSAVRVSVGAGAGPSVLLRVLSGEHVITEGRLSAGWGLAAAVIVPVKPLSHEIRDALICTSLGPGVGPITAEGEPRPGPAGRIGFSTLQLRVEYLRPGSRSWWSLASSVAYRLGLGRAVSGTWIAFLALLLMIAVGALASRLALADLR